MKKEQQILNKLAKYNEVQKVELSAEPMKVEFRDIKELKSVNSEAKQLIGKIDKVSGQYDSKLKSYQTAWSAMSDLTVMVNELDDNLKTFLKKANAEKTAFERNAKQLGIPASDIPEYDALLKSISSAESSQGQLQKMINISKNL